MAIKLSDFEKASYKAGGKTIEPLNLYRSIKDDPKKGQKYLARFRYEDKIYSKILGYSKKNGVISLSVKQASDLLDKYMQDIEEGFVPTQATTLDKLAELYFATLKDTDWNKTKKSVYNRYVGTYVEEGAKPKRVTKKLTADEIASKEFFLKNKIGHKSIESIREMHIKKIINDMDKQGLKPRTKKTVIEVLKPMYLFALKNKITKDNPVQDINIKVPSQKKIVTNATELFRRVYEGINTYYHDNPYHRALFLFGFTGRRKGEILNLKWENIDFKHNYYWIEDTKTSDQQKYQLPPYLIEPLQAINDDRRGLVFKSPITGEKIVNIDRQMRQLKKSIGMDNLSLHYMRNILVSALAEQEVSSITLSGILGHNDPNTINKYLSLNHFKSSQIGLDKIDDILDAEILD